MDEYRFRQNEFVKFSIMDGLNPIKCEGEVVGCATIPMPVLGRNYIVKVTSGPVPNSQYPFDTIVIAESGLRK